MKGKLLLKLKKSINLKNKLRNKLNIDTLDNLLRISMLSDSDSKLKEFDLNLSFELWEREKKGTKYFNVV